MPSAPCTPHGGAVGDNGTVGLHRVVPVLILAAVTSACAGPLRAEREQPVAAVAPDAVVPVAPAGAAPEPATTTTTPSASYRGAATTPTGVVVPVLGTSAGGWVVGTPCGRTATVPTVEGVAGTVVLDAGHGGSETGAIGPLGNRESDVNEAVVDHARRALESAGFPVVLTRTGDYRIGVVPRAAIVGAVKPRAAVSVHHNASYSEVRDTPGTEIFHQAIGTSAAESRRLAGLLYEEVTATLAAIDLAGWAATPRPGVKPRHNAAGDDFYGILRRTQGTPTALLEVGFISRRAEERLFARPEVQRAVGEAVARGVVRFLTTRDPGRGFIDPPRLADDPTRGGGTENCEDPPLG